MDKLEQLPPLRQAEKAWESVGRNGVRLGTIGGACGIFLLTG